MQFLVLAFAHRHPALTRNAGNIALLQMAADAELLPHALAQETAAAYREYRRLQHRVRLTGAAHQRAAGTSVVTDLLILRRREPGREPDTTPWEQARTTEADGAQVPVSEYFLGHPENVLGEMGAVRGAYRPGDLAVSPSDDTQGDLTRALGAVVASARQRGLAWTPAARAAPGRRRSRSLLGRALLVGLAILLGLRQWRLKRSFAPALWPVLAAALANWFLTAFNAFPGRDPTSSRYQYAGAVFILLILANLLKGVRPSRNALIAGAVVTACAIGPNLVILKDGRDILDPQSVLTRADTAALDIAERTVPEGFQLSPEVAGTPSLVNVYAGAYLDAADDSAHPPTARGSCSGRPRRPASRST